MIYRKGTVVKIKRTREYAVIDEYRAWKKDYRVATKAPSGVFRDEYYKPEELMFVHASDYKTFEEYCMEVFNHSYGER